MGHEILLCSRCRRTPSFYKVLTIFVVHFPQILILNVWYTEDRRPSEDSTTTPARRRLETVPTSGSNRLSILEEQGLHSGKTSATCR